MIKELEEAMIAKELDMLIVVSSDEHLNEYLPEHNFRLKASTTFENSSGFLGSAGTAIFCVGRRSHIFVDSRYHLQAEKDCAENFEIHKLGNNGVLEPHEWIASQSENSLTVGADPFVMSPREWRLYERTIKQNGHTLLPITPNLVDTVWVNRPKPPKNLIYPLPKKYTGKDSTVKLSEIQTELKNLSLSNDLQNFVLLVSKLDEIAWLTNLRGKDINHNPVFEAYAVIFQNRAICFCHIEDESLKDYCAGWEFKPYDEYKIFLEKLSKDNNVKVWVDPSSITMGTLLSFPESQVFEGKNPIVLSKAIKNSNEIKAMKNAHKLSGVALVKSFGRLQRAFEAGFNVTEKEFSDWLFKEYSELEGFSDLSFDTIAGSGPNGAIVHYTDLDTKKYMQNGEMLLVDSGIQCAGGTTDTTRTVILGEPDDKQKRIFTLVLQAHIRLARQVFPEGTTGASLDSITRSGLWNSGLDYGHGTGHGVGAFLSVHEGPQRISPLAHDVGLQKGMVISNEPGYYERNWGGIRLENLYVVKKVDGLQEHPGGKGWLGFETLTLVPFERRLIERSLLSSEEIKWLDEYHMRVLGEISPMIENYEDLQWLNWACGFN